MEPGATLETKVFDILYGLDKSGKTKTWEISVNRYTDYSEIIILYGYSKKIQVNRRINGGKNLDKSNATNHFEQAISEAMSKWTKKRDIEQYFTSTSQNLTTTTNTTTTPIHLPMLAQDFNKHEKKVMYPAAIQRKYDGYRAIFNSQNSLITTRQGKELTIIKESKELYDELKLLSTITPGIIFDGEMYTNDISFEALGVLRKTKKLTKDDYLNLSKIGYHIYDIIDLTKTFNERNKLLQNIFNEHKFKYLFNVETVYVNSKNEIAEYHSKFIEEGFEGTMIRNINGMYKEKYRSCDLLKYKDFMDSEFEIVDFTFEKNISGSDNNLIVWIIQTDKNVKVKVRPQGSKEEREDLYKQCIENFSQFKGRKLWTKFFEYTTDGSLRFPSTMRNTFIEYIRDEII